MYICIYICILYIHILYQKNYIKDKRKTVVGTKMIALMTVIVQVMNKKIWNQILSRCFPTSVRLRFF